jgi:hypothetical protein
MTAYRFDVTCPRCGTGLEHRAATEPTTRLCLTTRAVAVCPTCNLEWLITVELVPADPLAHVKGPARCGTEAGYKAHLRRNEKACDPCLNAHRVYVAGRPRRSHHRPKTGATSSPRDD